MPEAVEIPLSIVLTQQPLCAPDARFGLQDKAQQVQSGAPGVDGSLIYTFTLKVVRKEDGTLDFCGDYVHGKAGERFLYLSHGLPGAEWIQRWKLMLDSLPIEFLDGKRGVEARISELRGTRPPVEWRPML